MSALYIAVSSGMAWGVGGGGEETGRDRAIHDAVQQFVNEGARWGLAAEDSAVLAVFCPWETFRATREEALRVVKEGPLPWPPEESP
jgi:hypothetical protein